jgi:hypothetical protein
MKKIHLEKLSIWERSIVTGELLFLQNGTNSSRRHEAVRFMNCLGD